MIYAVPFGGGGQKSKHILPVHHRPLTSADRRRKKEQSSCENSAREVVEKSRISSRKRRIWTLAFLRRLDNGEE